ncbi:MAG: NERD domain-containing protein [Gammaproteobacteria bacterium]|nr:NERD domain-containing protein [Gammaproteobacteria bacterium]
MDEEDIITVHVGSGETLSEIAIRYGVTIDELQRWNRIEDPNLIQTGQTIVVHPDGYSLLEPAWIEGAFFLGVFAVLLFLLRPKPKSRPYPVTVRRFASPPHGTQSLKAQGVFRSNPTITIPPVYPSNLPLQAPKSKILHAPSPEVNDGERRVRRELARSYRDWILLNDVLLPSGNNGTAQIDHILISPGCVFLVETKDMNGWVFGSPGEKQWTQTFAAGHQSRRFGIKSKRYSFYNPLRQNEGHSRALTNLRIVDLWRLRPVTVFVGDAELKTADKFLPFDEHEKKASKDLNWRMRGVICMNLADLHRYIKFSVSPVSRPNMTRQTMEAIFAKIKSAAIPSTAESHARHVEYARHVKGEAPK